MRMTSPVGGFFPTTHAKASFMVSLISWVQNPTSYQFQKMRTRFRALFKRDMHVIAHVAPAIWLGETAMRGEEEI